MALLTAHYPGWDVMKHRKREWVCMQQSPIMVPPTYDLIKDVYVGPASNDADGYGKELQENKAVNIVDIKQIFI